MIRLAWWLGLACLGATFPKETLAIGSAFISAFVAFFKAVSTAITV